MESTGLLLELIAVSVCGKEPTAELEQACTQEMLEKACSLGADHDLAHLIGQATGKLKMPDCQAVRWAKEAAMQAFMRHVRQEYAFGTVCRLLEQAQISFIPLKGLVLRQWYPENWFRTSCDMDILIREADLESARQLLEQNGWNYIGKSSHDISLMSPQGVHLELHHTTIEDCVSEAGAAVMEGIWEDARPLPGKQYHMAVSDSLFYFYHMAHMAKHFLYGGCGLRSFLDVWILNHCVKPETERRAELLEKGGLTAFAKAAEKLADSWFSGAPLDEMSGQFQDFVLRGGTYGSLENRVSLQQGQEGGKWRFAMKRIFQPYDILKYRFPVLKKHRWLTPFFQPVRWFQLIFGGRWNHSVDEFTTAAEVTEGDQCAVRQLLDYLELEHK